MNKIIDLGRNFLKKLERPIHFRISNTSKTNITSKSLEKPVHFRNEIVLFNSAPRSLDRPIHFRISK